MTKRTDAEDSFEMSEYHQMLKKNWILAIIIFLVIAGAVVAYTFTAPRIYQARSLVMVTSQDQTLLLLGNTLSRIDIETQKEIILSASVLNPIYREFGIQAFKITAQSIKDSNVIEIRAESQNPMIAMKVANGVAESYVNYVQETRKQDALEVNSFIAEQIETYKTELDVLNTQVVYYTVKKDSENQTLTLEEELAYQSLLQTIAAKEKLYNYLLSKGEEVGIVAKEKSGHVKIIEYADLPTIPIKPNVILNFGLGLVLAIIGSIGIVFLKETLRNTFKSIDEVEAEFGPIVMGTIPKSRKRARAFLDFLSDRVFAENMRVLKTNLMFNLKDKDIRFISVTSPEEDGKSVVASNLALELAKSGKKVLLVDANLRKHELDKRLKIKGGEMGLSDVIQGKIKLNNAIKKTSRKNLFFLPSGKSKVWPSELITSENIKEILTKLRSSSVDVVIFDNASLKYSESIVLSANSQGVLFVIAFDKTKKDMALKARAALSKVKANIIGVVVNFCK
ncbi:polysaccharide biosynthesis tyrosine autokinase [Candidatus Woesearchaeota archaeon]|nr:polysaccharide biosynthesis tyrosine autokinase [Candidatus Woesearchaeota archaeon]